MPFTITRGTNISHWLSQSKHRGEYRKNWFTGEDVKWIADWGFDHIRLPIDEEQMWDESGTPDPEAFDLLDAALDASAQAGLKVIVDLHILRNHHFNQTGQPSLFTDEKEALKFAGLWRNLSNHLRSRPLENVAYELMNEAVALDAQDWNRVAMVAFQAIREREPDRTLVLGSNRWNSALTFNALSVPEDKNTLLTFHYYHPMLITHYQAPWWRDGGSYTGPIHYPGTPISAEDLARVEEPLRSVLAGMNQPFDAAAMLRDLAQPLAVAKRTGCGLYCGEFGVYNRVPFPLRASWYRDILRVFDEQQIAWANWDYKGGFGLVGHERNPTEIAALFKKT